MADDLNDVIERAAIDLQNMIDTGSIPEDDEGLYEAFGGKKGAGKVSVPKKLTDKQITAYFDFIGTPLTSKSEIASVVSAVRKNMTADVPATESKKMSKTLDKRVEQLNLIKESLFPDGVITPVSEIQERIAAGTHTIRDGLVARLYAKGMPVDPGLLKLDSTKEFAQALQKAFPVGPGSPSKGVEGYATLLNKLPKNNISLDSSFTDLSEAAKSTDFSSDIRKTVVDPIRSDVTAVSEGRLAKPTTGTRKLAKGAVPPGVLKGIMEGIGNIPDPVMRDAVVASLLGLRGTDLSGVATTAELAEQTLPARPFYDPTTGTLVSPDPELAGSGRKGKGPDRPLGPVMKQIMDRRYAAAVDGELFPGINTSKITAALKKYVYPNIDKETLAVLKNKPSGYTDLRRITASAIANQLGDPQAAAEIISHTGADGSDKIDRVMTGFYTDVENLDSLEARRSALVGFESLMADATGTVDAKGLGTYLNLDLPETFNAEYPKLEIKGSKVGSAVQITAATPEQIASDQQLRAAKTAEAAAAADLSAQEKSAAAEAKMIERAERAPEIVEAERKLAEARSGQKKAAQVASGEDFLAKALKMAKPLKVLAGPLGIGMAAIAAEQTRSAVTQQAEALGLPTPVAGAAGAVAGATEFLPIAPSDVIAAGQSMASPVADPGSARPIERMMADQPELFQRGEPAAPSADRVVPAAQPQMTQPVRVPDAVQNVPTSFLSNPERLRQARQASREGSEATGFISYTP
jgi:hypothetical protein